LIPIANFQIYTVDITGLVQQWVDGSLPNQGVMLIATPGAVESRFASREAPGLVQDPNISVDISQGGGTNTVYANKDTYLQESTPNANFGSSTELQVNPVPGNQKRALIGFDLSTIPPGSSVLSAKANFYNTQANSNPVLIHSITTDWTETGATWNNSPNIYDLNPIGSFIPASRNQYYSVDITTLVQQWMNGAIINRGLELIAASGAAETRYSSREQAGNAQDPFLTFILAPGGSLQALRIQNSNKGAWRQVDLSTAWSAQINIDYLRQGLDDLNDYVSLDISTDGGITWLELTRFTGPATDNQFQRISVDISSFLSPYTQVRLLSSGSMAVDDKVYFDNVEIAYTYGNPVGAGSVLLGGPGDDTLDGNFGATCYGGDGNDTFINCAVVIDP
jgi:hypothetical protein